MTFSRKVCFIEDNISGKVNFLRLGFKAPIATLIGSIADEYAWFASKLQFVCGVRAK